MKVPTLFTTMYMHAAPQDAGPASMRMTGAIGCFWLHMRATIQDRANGFRRTSLPRTPVNRGGVGWSLLGGLQEGTERPVEEGGDEREAERVGPGVGGRRGGRRREGGRGEGSARGRGQDGSLVAAHRPR